VLLGGHLVVAELDKVGELGVARVDDAVGFQGKLGPLGVIVGHPPFSRPHFPLSVLHQEEIDHPQIGIFVGFLLFYKLK
jgi:hypothetical protein